MKRFLLTIIAIISMVNTYATGFETIDGLRYLIDTDAKTATLVADTVKYAGDIVVPEKVKFNGVDYPVVAFAKRCFYFCKSLKSVAIPSSITSLGDQCFYKCDSLTSVIIPSSVISIGEMCFEFCSSLTSINIPYSVTLLGKSCFSECSSLTSVVISSSVISFGDNCFDGCTALISINIPSSVLSLGDACFWGCSSLTSIVIPPSVTSIGNNCFDGCNSLTSINIPASVTGIGGYCFENCDKLSTINCDAINPPQITWADSFGQSPTTILYVPSLSIEKYRQADGWKDFVLILPIPGTETDTKGKCEKPSITFAEGKLHFESSTIGANYHYTLTCNDEATDAYSEDGDVTLKAAYNISAYATADGYSTSDNATATLYWVDGKLDDPTGIGSTTSAKRGIVVSSQNGNVTLSGLDDGETVSFYSVNGSNLGKVKANHGVATDSFPQGQVIIVKVGKDSLKIAL